jgi:2-polyprenyl-6-methoxyphenol hydroxylase-like FAD-dependent oxidoreductase
VIASGAPAARRVRFDPGPAVLEGRYSPCQGVDAVYSPRRTILDKILVDAAREAGAEVRERFIVEEVLTDEGRVAGVRGRHKDGPPVKEAARLVVGADGKRSFVARAVRAAAYHQKPALSLGFYAYWEDVPLQGGEIYGRDRRAVGAWPTNEGMVMTYVAWPIEEFRAFHADVESNFLATLDLAGDLGERVRSGRRVGRFRGTPDLPNFFRKPYGPGWTLVGDAGLVMDPITGQGISDAFRDAELLSEAIVAGFDRQPLDSALEGYEEKRNHEALPMYEFTTELATFAPLKVEGEVLFTSLVGRQTEIDRFLGVLTGTVPMREYLTPSNLLRVTGVRGMAKVMLSKVRSGRPREPHRESLAQA